SRGDDLEVLPAGQVAVEPRLLDDRADPCERFSASRRDGQAEESHLSGAGGRQPEQRPDQRRFPGPVGAEIAEGDAAWNGQADVVDDGSMTEALGEPVGLDN